jgi:hypothetical protein
MVGRRRQDPDSGGVPVGRPAAQAARHGEIGGDTAMASCRIAADPVGWPDVAIATAARDGVSGR